ncbi:hypothetical protein NRB_10810 [Novosphingobium sp. 11B]
MWPNETANGPAQRLKISSIADAEFAKLNMPLMRHFSELAHALGRDRGDLLDLAGIKFATFRDGAADLTCYRAIRCGSA